MQAGSCVGMHVDVKTNAVMQAYLQAGRQDRQARPGRTGRTGRPGRHADRLVYCHASTHARTNIKRQTRSHVHAIQAFGNKVVPSSDSLAK